MCVFDHLPQEPAQQDKTLLVAGFLLAEKLPLVRVASVFNKVNALDLLLMELAYMMVRNDDVMQLARPERRPAFDDNFVIGLVAGRSRACVQVVKRRVWNQTTTLLDVETVGVAPRVVAEVDVAQVRPGAAENLVRQVSITLEENSQAQPSQIVSDDPVVTRCVRDALRELAAVLHKAFVVSMPSEIVCLGPVTVQAVVPGNKDGVVDILHLHGIGRSCLTGGKGSCP